MTQRLALAALILIVAFPPAANAASKTPVCEAVSLAAVAKIPQLPLTCQDDGSQLCSSDTPSTLYDNPECKSVAGIYAKRLDKILTPRWWGTKTDALETCRVHGKAGALTNDESDNLEMGYGPLVQGNDRVRMLVLPDVCTVAGMANVILVVRTARGNVVTPLYFAFNQGGQEGPYELDVVTSGADTYALFSTQGHDMQAAYTTTTAYKIDPASGVAQLYPLFVDEVGETAQFSASEPVVDYTSDDQTAMVTTDGRFRPMFIRHTATGCDPDDAKCMPVKKQVYTWSGHAFVGDGSAADAKARARQLAAQRACLAAKFDSKTGTSGGCGVDLECEGNNDLSLLSYKAGLFARARQYGADALQSCFGRAKETAAAEFNYLRAKNAAGR